MADKEIRKDTIMEFLGLKREEILKILPLNETEAFIQLHQFNFEYKAFNHGVKEENCPRIECPICNAIVTEKLREEQKKWKRIAEYKRR